MRRERSAHVAALLLLAVFFLLGLLLPGIHWQLQQRSLSASAADGDLARIDALRARRFFVRFNHGSRVSGSRGLRRAGDELLAALAEDDIRGAVRGGQMLLAPAAGFAQLAGLRNILVHLRGQGDGSRALLLMAHYDSAPGSEGANDDGAGVGAIVAALRALKASGRIYRDAAGDLRLQAPVDLMALFTDGEERGLLGARAFLQDDALANRVAAVVNLEARGADGPPLLFELGPGSGGLVRSALRSPAVQFHSLSDPLFGLLPYGTDFAPFKSAGIAGVNLAFIEGPEHYHNALDAVAYSNFASHLALAGAALRIAEDWIANANPQSSMQPDLAGFSLGSGGILLERRSAQVLSLLAASIWLWIAFWHLRRCSAGRMLSLWLSVRWLVPWIVLALCWLLIWRGAQAWLPEFAGRSSGGEICTAKWLKPGLLLALIGLAWRWRLRCPALRQAETARFERALIFGMLALLFSFDGAAAAWLALPLAAGALPAQGALRLASPWRMVAESLALAPLAISLGWLCSLLHFSLALSSMCGWTALPAALLPSLAAGAIAEQQWQRRSALVCILGGAALALGSMLGANVSCPLQDSLIYLQAGGEAQYASCDQPADAFVQSVLGADSAERPPLITAAPLCWPFGRVGASPRFVARGAPPPLLQFQTAPGLLRLRAQSRRAAPHLLLRLQHSSPLELEWSGKRIRLQAPDRWYSPAPGATLLLISDSNLPGGAVELQIRGSVQAIQLIDQSSGLPWGLQPAGRAALPGGRFPWNDGMIVAGPRFALPALAE
ncbi:MAG: M28 family peptidase [Leptospirales bacterium]|nr:M28 family peptidase [Leptospirales bacterium]